MKSASKYTLRTPLKRERTALSSSSESIASVQSTGNAKEMKEKEPVQVFCRLRPLADDSESCVSLLSSSTLCLTSPSEAKVMRRDMQYVFKHIFTSYSSQKELFDHVALPLVEDLLNGKNSLMFTYGVTGSGKTYTLTGEPENPGIMPRCIDTIFNTIEDMQTPKFVIKSDRMNGFEVQSNEDANDERINEMRAARMQNTPRKSPSSNRIYANEGTKIANVDDTNLYAVFVSYTEVYNNTVFDLLDESSGKVLQGKILREDAQRNMYVNGVVEVEVKSANEAFDLFYSGQRRRRIGYTVLNAESSRSHSIFSIRVVQLKQVAKNSNGQAMIPDGNLLKIGQLNLVDLAGSERTNRTQNTGIRLREASSINNSLMSLRACLEVLRENQQSGGSKLVPYRDSRLTLLFKNYFEGEGKVAMIVCANPSINDYEENLHVMKFAELTQDVKVNKHENNRFTPYKAKSRIGIQCNTPSTASKRDKAKEYANNISTPMIGFAPKLPLINLISKDDDSSNVNPQDISAILTRAVKVLKMRKQKGYAFNSDVSLKQNAFRKRLLSLGHDNVVALAEVRSLKSLLQKEKAKQEQLERKLIEAENVNDEWLIKNKENMDIIKSLENKNQEKDFKLSQNLLEREKYKQRHAIKEEKMSQELDEKLRRQRQHLHRALVQKDQKIRKVRELLDDMELPEVTMLQDFSPEKKMKTQNQEMQTPQQVLRTPSAAAAAAASGNPQKIGTTPRHRRSRSCGEVWLEHNAIKPVPLGTVLQPNMKRRKSVTKLTKASDITDPKTNKYCLLAQEADSGGELETKVYKADIVQTCGGGAQVIFNDVERLRQESPS